MGDDSGEGADGCVGPLACGTCPAGVNAAPVAAPASVTGAVDAFSTALVESRELAGMVCVKLFGATAAAGAATIEPLSEVRFESDC